MNDAVKEAQHPGKRFLPTLGVTTQELRPDTQALLTEIQSLRAGVRWRMWVVSAVVVGANVTLIKLLP